VLRILLSIGGTEIMHFQTWQDKAGNAPPLTDPTNGLVFPDLNADGELTQTNLIMPERQSSSIVRSRSARSSAPPRPMAPPRARSTALSPTDCSSVNRRRSLLS